jgi:hypothetical protein
MTELERLLHNLVSATAEVVMVPSDMKQINAAEQQRDEAVKALADYLEPRERK